MPAPPINPQLLLGLLRNFPGIAPINPSIFTPPILAAQRATLPRVTNRDADRQGRVGPERVTGNMPSGGAAPTAPGTTPSPSSLGQVLSRVPATPATLAGQDDFGQPVQATPVDPTKVGKVIEGGGGTVPAGAEQFDAPDITPPGGTAWVDGENVYVKDKEGRLIRSMPRKKYGPGEKYDPNAPQAGSPASMPQKKGGIWDRLTDPSLAGIALAAGQQMTRARYPGESGIGNAVNAVTAGYNTLAQQRQMQVARELAEREWQAKQAKAAQDKLESEAKVGDYKSQGERRKAQTEDEARKAKAAQTAANVKEVFDTAEANRKSRETDIDQQRVTNTKAYNDDILRQGDLRVNIAEKQAMTAEETLKELRKRNAGLDQIRAAELAVKQRQVAVDEAREHRQGLEETSNIEKFIAPARMLVDMEDEQNQKYYEAGGQRPVGPPKSVEQRTIEKATELKRGADAAKGRVTTAAPSTQAAPAASGRVLGPVSDPRQEVEGRTGSYNGVPGIVRNGQWVAR